jgi:hypothetical protein
VARAQPAGSHTQGSRVPQGSRIGLKVNPLFMKPGKEIHVPVLVELDENGVFIVSCPLYKGCHTYGKNIDEAMRNLKEVVQMCIEE